MGGCADLGMCGVPTHSISRPLEVSAHRTLAIMSPRTEPGGGTGTVLWRSAASARGSRDHASSRAHHGPTPRTARMGECVSR